MYYVESKYIYDNNNYYSLPILHNNAYYLRVNMNNQAYYPVSSYYNNLSNQPLLLYFHYPNYYLNYNVMPKTPTPSINKIINNNYHNNNQIKYISKSPEPYIRRFNYEKYKLPIYTNSKNKRDFQLLNKNNIRNNPIPLPIVKLEEKEKKSRTPEPILLKRNKHKNSNIRNRVINYKTNTFSPLKTNENYRFYKAEKIYSNNKGIDKLVGINYINYNSKISHLFPNYKYYQGINNYQNNKLKIHVNRFKNMNIREYDIKNQVYTEDLNISEFIIINLIGQGTFGKIYQVQWIKNNLLYAMKILKSQNLEQLRKLKKIVKIIKLLSEKLNNFGFMKILGDKYFPVFGQQNLYNYYIIMELAERDWEQEIQNRFLYQKFYTENELSQIIYQLIKTFSLLQRYNISHGDVKPENILIIKGFFKICDFGEAKIVDRSGYIIQPVRGSQLYLSPILFYAYNQNIEKVLHNPYKSDVFSLGMCFLLAGSLSGYALYDIRELMDMKEISKIILNHLNKRYSLKIINLIIKMLQIDEKLRMDFIELESFIAN